MYESRTVTIKKKPRIILNNSFNKGFSNYQVKDKGQCIIDGIIINERLEPSEDGNEYLVKTIEINKIEVIENNNTRTS